MVARLKKVKTVRGLRPARKLISRKVKKLTLDIVSRRDQPQVRASVPKLKKQSIELGKVSSSWITALSYAKETKVASMLLKDGKLYHYYDIPFRVFEAWYHAHSKGTFHNLYIRGNYDYRRIA